MRRAKAFERSPANWTQSSKSSRKGGEKRHIWKPNIVLLPYGSKKRQSNTHRRVSRGDSGPTSRDGQKELRRAAAGLVVQGQRRPKRGRHEIRDPAGTI